LISVRARPAVPLTIDPPTCIVVDVETACDLPQRAENLGWVSIPVEADAEQTANALYERACALGGNALTRVMRVQLLGEDGFRLEANAWRIPTEDPSTEGQLRNAR
jgi:hypothetical protein